MPLPASEVRSEEVAVAATPAAPAVIAFAGFVAAEEAAAAAADANATFLRYDRYAESDNGNRGIHGQFLHTLSCSSTTRRAHFRTRHERVQLVAEERVCLGRSRYFIQ